MELSHASVALLHQPAFLEPAFHIARKGLGGEEALQARPKTLERESFIDNLLVRIHFITEKIQRDNECLTAHLPVGSYLPSYMERMHHENLGWHPHLWGSGLQGYLAHKKQPPTLGPP